MERFLLIDCNNFFVSCERIFNPKLHNKPVVVLSSNDACIIARSNEAKAIGIPMGIPVFKCKELLRRYNVITLSSNFSLYADMSSRVIQTVAALATNIEVYSIDELFAFIPPAITHSDDYYSAYAHFIRHTVKQHTGIPVSIGIGPTKTLAKVANKIAKQNQAYNGVFNVTDCSTIDEQLKLIPVHDVWGIGSRSTKKLAAYNIRTAFDFKYTAYSWVKKYMTVIGAKTLLELRGISCLKLSEVSARRKSIRVSRSFGQPINNLADLKEAVARYTQKGAAKLRAQHRAAGRLTVFALYTSYKDTYKHYTSTSTSMTPATAYTPYILTQAQACVTKLYKPGFLYKKAGILFEDLIPYDEIQTNITNFSRITNHRKQQQIMEAIDGINRKIKSNIVSFAAAGIKPTWLAKQEKKSAAFTTNWHELLTIKI